MKHKITSYLITALLVAISAAGVVSVSTTPLAAACNPVNGTTTGGTGEDCADETSFGFNNKNTEVGINDLVIEVLRFLSIAVGIAVAGGITAGGIMYSMSKGNPANAQKGIKIITNAVIGLVLYLLMFAVINFLVPGGVLS